MWSGGELLTNWCISAALMSCFRMGGGAGACVYRYQGASLWPS